MFRMWFFTVFSEMYSSFAMSRLFMPFATNRRTSISRSVSRGAGTWDRSPVVLLMAANSFRSLDVVDGGLREQVPGGPRLDGVVEVGLLVGDREHEDLDVRQQVLDLRGRLDPRTLGHPDVHQDHVGHELLGSLDGLDPVRRLPDQVDVGFGLQDHLEPPAEQRVVTLDEHPQSLVRADTRRSLALVRLVTLARSLRCHGTSANPGARRLTRSRRVPGRPWTILDDRPP